MTLKSESERLEELWGGEFGDEYVGRNQRSRESDRLRSAFWDEMLVELQPSSVLEVGCNVGGNLQWISQHVSPVDVFGVDINLNALMALRERLPEVNALHCQARKLPFRDGWFDLVFTMGVLIHQPEATLPLVMSEMVRCSNNWVLCGEYFADETVEVPYRGESGALFKRDYGRLFSELFPELRLEKQGYLSKESGWDDVTWWLFRKVGNSAGK